MLRRGVALALLGAVACSGDSDTSVADTAQRTATDSLTNRDSIEAVQRAESLASALDLWNSSEVVSRLEQAGLVVRDLERQVSAPGFEVSGAALAVSGGELVVFLYPSAEARRSATERLDSLTAAPPDVTDSVWQSRPRLITSGNLAAVLMTTSEQLAERVRNVLTARHGG